MGVIGLNKYFNQYIPEAFVEIQQPLYVDNLLFDLNTLVFDVFRNIEKIEEFLDYFFNKILSIITHLKPQKNIFFAFDGVSPAAKNYTQINRRLIRNLENKSTVSIIDSNSVTAGTPFMENLNFHFKKFIKNNIDKLRNGHVKIYYSSHLEPGEGEYKIFKFIKENSFKNYEQIIYGCDSDLILSSFLYFDSNIVILQEMNNYFNYTYTCKIKEFLLKKFDFFKEKNEEIIIRDIVFLIIMKGTDYIASAPGFEKNEDIIDKMINVYIEYHKKYELGYLYDKNGLNLNNLKIFFYELKKIDFDNVKQVTNYDLEDFNHFKKINYKSNYPNICSHKDFVKISSDYIKSLFWNLKLYEGEILSWDWNYNYIFPPFLSDIVVDEKSINFHFLPSNPLTPYECLIKIIPQDSFKVLPEPLQPFKFYLSNSNTYFYLRRLYRKKFLIIKNKNQSYLNPILEEEFFSKLTVEKTEMY